MTSSKPHVRSQNVSINDDEPLRSELLSDEHFSEIAKPIAQNCHSSPLAQPRLLLARLKANDLVIRSAHSHLVEAAARNEPLMPDAEWLLDNFFVIEETLQGVRKDLPRNYYDELPVASTGIWSGLPRIYGLAATLVAHSDSHLEEERIARFVAAFQESSALSTGELWAVPIMIRLVLLENLSRLSKQMMKSREERRRAIGWVEQNSASHTIPQLPTNPSDAFLVAWLQAVRDIGDSASAVPQDQVQYDAQDLAEILRREHRRQAANQVSVGNAVTSLRLLNAVDWTAFFERLSRVEDILRREPTGTYGKQEFATRDAYRTAVEQLAKAACRDELEVAALAVSRAAAGGTPREQHVGYHLVSEGRRAFARDLNCRFPFCDRWRHFLRNRPRIAYFGLLAFLTGGTSALLALMSAQAGSSPGLSLLVAMVTFLPASEVAVLVVNWLVCRVLPPRVLPKLDFTAGIPAEWRTIVVIPGMLTKSESAASLCERLELHYLANPDPQLRFALLTDWADSLTETTPGDDELVQNALRGIRRLNDKYSQNGPDLFLLFHRRRHWNPSENVWMGWERKRGKLEEFNRLLRGDATTSYCVQSASASALDVRFVLTLDADTVLPRDAARRMIATLAHPLNRPVLSHDGRQVVAGYGLLQPRVSFLYRAGLRSRFARIFAGSAGIDPYSSASSDVYQDLFGEGNFTGKGLYDVAAFHATAGQAFPENAILSHDLIESNFARCALVTDVEVFDDFPAKYHAYARREHRWIRGDWQLLPWLGGSAPTAHGRKRNPLSLLARWKILDNLRRSLVPLSLVTLLTLGWLVLPAPGWVWSVAALTVLSVPLLLQLISISLGLMFATFPRNVLRAAKQDLPKTLNQVCLSAVFLANQATIAADAIGRTLYRLLVSRQRFLEWETAAAAEARLGIGLLPFVRSMWPSLAITIALLGIIANSNPTRLPSAIPWLLAWILAPLVAWWVSRPLAEKEISLTPGVVTELRRVSRKTWRFFEAFVTEEDHWLPPDNFQEHPRGVIAHRTSPTNVGLYFLSALSAHDLGYISLPTLVKRTSQTLETLDRLERFRGHFLNWYETNSLRTLSPAYVSTVDSGNLLGCLLSFKHGLLAKADEPIPSPAAIDGLRDTFLFAADHMSEEMTRAIRQHLEVRPTDLFGWEDWFAGFEKRLATFPTHEGDTDWRQLLRNQLRERQAELATVCPWIPELRAFSLMEPNHPVLAMLGKPLGVKGWSQTLPEILPMLPASADALASALAKSEAMKLTATLTSLSIQADRLANEMDFKFLYNDSRHLFSIGYNVPLERLDSAHYDLLASEAAITCYLSVARGVVPRKHWFQLGRLVVSAAGLPGLMSWGGTMFEYLMPRLLLAPPPGTMLDVAQKAAVARQIEYGLQTGTPWGVSESGFNVLSPDGDYQYQSFGVPGLGLKRGLAKDIVVAPYATLLAVMTDASAAVSNLRSLREAGGEGPFGFYEAIDYTPGRLGRGEKHHVIKSYMAHHQGMALCAMTNCLMTDIHCRRLQAEPAVRAVDLLLQERVPLEANEVQPETESEELAKESNAKSDVIRRISTPHTPAPRTHLLSNGQYTVLLTNSGGGFSACRGQAVTRWRSDLTRDNHGMFLYLRDQTTKRTWSAGYQPIATDAEVYEATFAADKAEYHRRDGMIETFLEVIVAPDQDAEIRRLRLVNHDASPRTIEVTSYVEVVLNDARADLAHPSFGKLFLETEWLSGLNVMLCRRRPRSIEQRESFAVHFLSGEQASGPTERETDRATFLGRRRTTANPAALDRRLNGSMGPVLDPIMSLRKKVRLEANSTSSLSFITAVCVSRDAAIALAEHYRTPSATERAFDLAWVHSRVELRHLGITAAESHLFQRLAGHILFPPLGLRSPVALKENRFGQSAMWRFGISGDLPILLVSISDGDGIAVARQALKAHAFWRGRGFVVDLVLLADRPASYREELYEELAALARTSDSRDQIDKPGGVFVRKVQPGSEERTILLSAARVALYGDRGSFADQTDSLSRGQPLPSALVPRRPGEMEVRDEPIVDGLVFFNGTGGFTEDGREYVITSTPPLPWVNVLANPDSGVLASDSGPGFSWAGNSQSNRLTPWSNDPISDPPSAAVYLRDDETGLFWTPTPRPAGGPTAVWHGPGYTSYAADRDGLTAELVVFVPVSDPVTVFRLRITNHTERARKLSTVFFAEWALGTTREQTAAQIVTEIDTASQALFARSPFSEDYGTAIAFADISLRPRSVTGDRREFLGRNRSPANPAALGRVELSGQVGPALDPCAALMGSVTVPARGFTEVAFVLGQAGNSSEAGRLALHYRQVQYANAALKDVIDSWDRRLGHLTVKTPDPSFDILVNRWLLYQVLACRLWARSAFYQSGGAYGYRDQLQDVMALLYAEPGMAREHIVRAASRQFSEGDVQHWWHPPTGRGVRTRFSDDFLWLPYAVARYVTVTGDATILAENVPFLRGPTLKPEEHELYFLPEESQETASVYDHCLRALEYGRNYGSHGLPLMGCGDWNDGMNRVGSDGVGESVWVAWFQIVVRTDFAEIAATRDDSLNANRLRDEARKLREAVETHAWDGEWYRRAWFDDGTVLGTQGSEECEIDSLPQSWAVFAQGNSARARQAMRSALSKLVDSEARLIKLFKPPFDTGPLQPGYIKGYVPGIRENGGQYTHAAVWLVQALAEQGEGTEAFRLWSMLNPIHHASTPEGVARYRIEPYVMAGDVYAAEHHKGRGGWSWYTGSAAWMYRVAVETILGLRKHGSNLSFDPRIPDEWPGFEVQYQHGKSLYKCVIERTPSNAHSEAQLWIDGIYKPDGVIPLVDDAQIHHVRIHLGSQPKMSSTASS